MSNEEAHKLRAHLRKAIAEAQARQDAYTGDYAGGRDLSKQIGTLHVALLSAGGSMRDKEAIAAGVAQTTGATRRFVPTRPK